MPSFPCPNPSCTQSFSSEDVRGAASLKCPKCGTVFQFRSGPPAGKAKTPRTAPVAPPVVAEESLEEFVPPDPMTLRRRAARKPTRGSGKWVVLAVAALLIFGGGGLLAVVYRDDIAEALKPGALEGGPAVTSSALNYRLRYPEEGWEQDRDVQRAFGANLVLRRRSPNTWLALAVTDYKDRLPRDDEMIRVARGRLRGYFNAPEHELRDLETLGGRPAQRLVFQGALNNVAMSGECHMMSFGGIGYWLFTWTPSAGDLDAALKEWQGLREGFTLLKERDGWTGKVPKMIPAEGKKAKYGLKYPEDLWSPLEATDTADLVLLGRDPEDPKNALKTATITTFVRAEANGLEAAIKEARDFAEAHEKEAFPGLKAEAVPAADKSGLPEGPVDLGKLRAQVVRLRLKDGEERERFLAVAAVPRPGYTLVILCECAWSFREAWEERFGPVLHSLAPGK